MKLTGFFLFASAILISIIAIKGTFVSYLPKPQPQPQPQPTYYQPPPTYYQPPPTYYQPPPTYNCPPPKVVNVCEPTGGNTNNNCNYPPCDPRNSISYCGHWNGNCKNFTCSSEIDKYNCQYNARVEKVSATYCNGLQQGDNFRPCSNNPK